MVMRILREFYESMLHILYANNNNVIIIITIIIFNSILLYYNKLL